MGVNPNFPAPVALSANGSSEPIKLREGRWELELYATTWDAGNPVTIQKATEDIEARYGTISDPYESSYTLLSRTANGPTITVQTGGCFVRINAPAIGTATGVTLVAKFIGP